MPEPRKRPVSVSEAGKNRAVVYMNEWEPYAAAWLKNLFPDAEVDLTDIRELSSARLERRTRVHFFAGIGGWEYALQLAGWPRDRPVWTGSCPCQPFSTAGKMRGFDDDRHLWPFMRDRIRDLRPPTVFGEQVGGPGGLEWMSRVRDDLEDLSYAVGVAYLPACSVGAPHKRNRAYWVAHSYVDVGQVGPARHEKIQRTRNDNDSIDNGSIVTNVSSDEIEIHEQWEIPFNQSGIVPLAHGFPGSVDQLRTYGNAIVPQVAALFIRSYMEVVGII